MKNSFIANHEIAYIEIYTSMAKALAYWHQKALGFSLIAKRVDVQNNTSSFLLKSNSINLVLTSTYPTKTGNQVNDISNFTEKYYCGVKRIALKTDNVVETFHSTIEKGAIPISFPTSQEDDDGIVYEASIKLFDDSEILFINMDEYTGVFKPNYIAEENDSVVGEFFSEVDHIASELRMNEINYWTNYISDVLGTELAQTIKRGSNNSTGMLLNISQSYDKKITLVMAEPDYQEKPSKIQKNVEMFGSGIHHIAFSTDDMMKTVDELSKNNVEFVNFPSAYYDILREENNIEGFDIDILEKYGILIDKVGDSYLLQKFITPITERPFFFYEIVQRVNGYNAFALKNINVLKKAEELQIMKSDV